MLVAGRSNKEIGSPLGNWGPYRESSCGQAHAEGRRGESYRRFTPVHTRSFSQNTSKTTVSIAVFLAIAQKMLPFNERQLNRPLTTRPSSK